MNPKRLKRKEWIERISKSKHVSEKTKDSLRKFPEAYKMRDLKAILRLIKLRKGGKVNGEIL